MTEQPAASVVEREGSSPAELGGDGAGGGKRSGGQEGGKSLQQSDCLAIRTRLEKPLRHDVQATPATLPIPEPAHSHSCGRNLFVNYRFGRPVHSESHPRQPLKEHQVFATGEGKRWIEGLWHQIQETGTPYQNIARAIEYAGRAIR